MVNLSKSGNDVYILFATANFISGKAVTMEVYDNINDEIDGSPFTLTEIHATGMYEKTFIPNTIGQYKIKIFVDAIPKAAASIKITNSDLEDINEIKTKVEGIEQQVKKPVLKHS